jgi:hypothetical protein
VKEMAEQKYWMKSNRFNWGYVTLEEARDKVASDGANHWSKAQGDMVSVVSQDGQDEFEMKCLPDGEGVVVKRRK